MQKAEHPCVSTSTARFCCLSVCACACDVFQALGREVKCIVQNGKKKSDVRDHLNGAKRS